MKKYVSKFSAISFTVLSVTLPVYFFSIYSTAVADAINGTVSVGVRFLLSILTYYIPFSLFELLVILSPVILLILIFALLKFGVDARVRIRNILSLLAVISIIITSYVYTLGVGYRTTPLAGKLGLEDRQDLTVDEIYYTTVKVADELNQLAEKLELQDGCTVMPYSVDEMSERLVFAYDSFNDRYGVLTNYTSRVKPVYFSTVMSDLGISGIYSFFTGEANVNVEYPDYCLPSTAAHELAHQRGISRENEANFTAFLVCISSDDEYIRYSGYLNLYEYLASALYSMDKQLYDSVRSSLSPVAVADMRAANAVYVKHKDSPLGKLNERLNDAYLKANGTEGVITYGYVVRLAVAYYTSEK